MGSQDDNKQCYSSGIFYVHYHLHRKIKFCLLFGCPEGLISNDLATLTIDSIKIEKSDPTNSV